MRFYPPWCLRALRRLCDEYGVPLVLDEIATGFGRTGAMFAADHASVTADIVCVGKALTGGYLSMAATLCSAHIAETISDGQPGMLMHGPTFMANPLAAAVACASLDLLGATPWQARIAAIERALRAAIEPARDLPGVKDVRALGGIGVIETVNPVNVALVTAAAMREGVWLRPFGRLVYAMPPYVVTETEIDAIGRALYAGATAAASL
jgi:adenosylmethionine-8-amino-7-oxononanoate aminotransferase